LESLQLVEDTHNVLGSYPTLTDKGLGELYTPLWDLNIGEWNADLERFQYN
jgi:hypothetical protein